MSDTSAMARLKSALSEVNLGRDLDSTPAGLLAHDSHILH
jgi:hypothetical protein